MSSAATAPLPLPVPPYPHQPIPALNVRQDLRKALTLIHRSSSLRDFLLDPSSADADVRLLLSPRPAFTILTEEEQEGALPGRIALRYLGVPAFAHPSGLSGGAVVTSYADRTHPLHAPAVMADVRVGRYVRDEVTGEWCIITRNATDRITRLQYVRVSNRLQRERICLTCSTDLFDAGHFLKSVLFQCHDREWRLCPTCGAPPVQSCMCATHPPFRPHRQQHAQRLAAAAGAVMREGPAKWVGKVRVTVLSNISRSKLLDIDECMDVRASYEPTMDAALAADMQRLAIFEKAKDYATIPAPLKPSDMHPVTEQVASPFVAPANDYKTEPEPFPDDISPSNVFMTDELPTSSTLDSGTPSSSDDYFIDGDFPAVPDSVPWDDPWIPSPAPRYELPEFLESPMLPADPSTLPGGIELCMDGMDLQEDWGAFMHNHTKDAVSSASTVTDSSTASNCTVDQFVPQPAMAPDNDNNTNDHLPRPPEHVLPKPQPQRQVHQSTLNPAPMPSTAHFQPLTPPPTHQSQSQAQLHPHSHAQPMQQFPLPQSTAPPTPVPIAMPPVVPKEEAELLMEANEHKPLPTNRGVTLAPRPAGMAACADGFIWQMGTVPGNMYLLEARLDAMEKERKAEERRKKNRQAAARSNARKKGIMDGFKSQIKANRARAEELRKHELELREANRKLRRQMEMSD